MIGCLAAAAWVLNRPVANANQPPGTFVAPGRVVFSDDFHDNSSGWYEGETDGVDYEYTAGGYTIAMTSSVVTVVTAVYSRAPYVDGQGSLAITARQSISPGTGSNSGFGVKCRRGSGVDRFQYEFLLRTSGAWGVYVRTGEPSSTSYSTRLKSGSGATYAGATPATIVGMCDTQADGTTTKLTFAINGNVVADFSDTDSSLPRDGWVGSIEAAIGAPGGTVTTTSFEERDASAAAATTPRPGATAAAHAGFATVGSMQVARYQHTATLLDDSRVLVVGGIGTTGILASSEIYDPATKVFTASGSMASARTGHTATLLRDGRVLIAGGANSTGALDSAELYDPKSGTFVGTGPMTTDRENHAATLLMDGRVLITGGSDSAGHILESGELYNPQTGEFTAAGLMANAGEGQDSVLLADGQVLIVGATGDAPAELYDPDKGVFTQTGPLKWSPSASTATLLMDGRVLVAGGWGLVSAQVYDSDTNSFTSTGSMAFGRGGHTATRLNDGNVLVVGGSSGGLASAELYHPSTGTFGPTSSMATPRYSHTATLLADGSVLITGGENRASGPLASAELYRPQ